MILYIDTSVLAPYYCPEHLSTRAQELLINEDHQPAVSSLTEVELYSAVARKVRMNEMSGTDGNRILTRFSSHMSSGLFKIISVKDHHWQMAKGWIALFSTPLRTLDALHLAVAAAEDLELVTADKHLYQAAGILDIPARFLAAD